jgi:hypothetical protein
LISYALRPSSVLVLNLFVFNVLPFSRSLARFGFGAVLLAHLSIHFMVFFFLWILEGSLRGRVLVSSAILVTSTPLPLLVFHLLLLFLVGLCGVTRFVLCIAFLADLGAFPSRDWVRFVLLPICFGFAWPPAAAVSYFFRG